MKGYGLTVVEGERIERFDVEVLGVVPNLSPGRSVIVVRASGLGLEKSGIVAGMSGSPVYLDGKLAGALSTGFPFAREAVGGVTPIEPMLAIEAGVPGPPPAARPAARRGAPAVSGGEELLAALASPPEERLAFLTTRFGQLQALLPPAEPSPLLAPSFGGFPADTLLRNVAVLSRLGIPAAGSPLPAAPAPPPAPAAAAPLAAGSAITALLVDGDLQIGVTGTVTRVEPDGRFVAFGHPFLGFGELEVPVAPARVVTILSSLFQSFKIGYPGGPASYRLTRDRDSGVSGRTDRTAPMVPVRFRFEADGESRDLAWRLAPQPRLFPVLLALSTDAAMTTSDPTPREKTLRFRVAFRTSAGEVAWEDRITGARAKETAVLTSAVLAGLLSENDLADPEISGVTIDVASEPGEKRLRIVDAALATRKVAPGGEARVTVRLDDRRGAETTRVLRLAVPAELPEGHAAIVVGDGNTLSGLRLTLNPGEPRTLKDLRQALAQLVPADRLGAALVVPARGAATGPGTLSALPPTAASLLAEGERGEVSRGTLGSRVAAEEILELDRPVAGSIRLEVDVERPRS